MIEIPEDLKGFNIRVVYCGEKTDPYKVVAKKAVKEMIDEGVIKGITKEMIDKYMWKESEKQMKMSKKERQAFIERSKDNISKYSIYSM